MSDFPQADAPETGAVTELLRTTSRLIAVLEREIDMLRQMKPREMQALQEEKIVLAAAYESQLKRIAGEPELAQGMPADLQAELKDATDRFQTTLAENERALRAAKQATDSLLEAIVEAVDKQTPETGYAANGRQRTYAPTAARSVAIDQRF